MAALALGGIVRLGDWIISRLDQREAARARLAASATAESIRIVRRLEGIVDQQKLELDTYEKERGRNRETLANLKVKVDGLTDEVAKIRGENAELRGQVAQLQGQLDARDGELSRMRAERRS